MIEALQTHGLIYGGFLGLNESLVAILGKKVVMIPSQKKCNH
jgi:hypothetical protein